MKAIAEMATISKLKAELLDLLETLKFADDDCTKALVEQRVIDLIRSIQERENFLIDEL